MGRISGPELGGDLGVALGQPEGLVVSYRYGRIVVIWDTHGGCREGTIVDEMTQGEIEAEYLEQKRQEDLLSAKLAKQKVKDENHRRWWLNCWGEPREYNVDRAAPWNW